MLVITALRGEAIELVFTDSAGNALATGAVRVQRVLSGEKVRLELDLPRSVSVTRESAKNKDAKRRREP